MIDQITIPQLTLSLTTVTAAGTALWRVAKAFGRVEVLEAQLKGHDTRLEAMEGKHRQAEIDLAEIKTHLSWIRLTLSRFNPEDPMGANHRNN